MGNLSADIDPGVDVQICEDSVRDRIAEIVKTHVYAVRSSPVNTDDVDSC
jgi:hypothetical protein